MSSWKNLCVPNSKWNKITYIQIENIEKLKMQWENIEDKMYHLQQEQSFVQNWRKKMELMLVCELTARRGWFGV